MSSGIATTRPIGSSCKTQWIPRPAAYSTKALRSSASKKMYSIMVWRRASCPAGTRRSILPLFNDRVQFAPGIARHHRVQRNRLDFRGLSGAAESFIACLADFLHRLGGSGEEFARIEVLGVLREITAGRAGRRYAQVGVDVHLAHTVLD